MRFWFGFWLWCFVRVLDRALVVLFVSCLLLHSLLVLLSCLRLSLVLVFGYGSGFGADLDHVRLMCQDFHFIFLLFELDVKSY